VSKNTKKRKPISLIIYHHKGGVGKTTIASWLSYLLATGGIAKKDKKLNVVLASSDILFDRPFVYYPVNGVETLSVLPSEGRVDRLNEVMHKDDFIPLIGDLAERYIDIETEMGEVDIIIFDTPPSKTAICEGFLSVFVKLVVAITTLCTLSLDTILFRV